MSNIAVQCGIFKTTAHMATKMLKFKPYKIRNVHIYYFQTVKCEYSFLGGFNDQFMTTEKITKEELQRVSNNFFSRGETYICIGRQQFAI